MKKINTNCRHDGSLEKIGYWDDTEKGTGRAIGGPVVRCEICGSEMKISWGQWRGVQGSFHLTQQKLV